jgi:hypothetical protein
MLFSVVDDRSGVAYQEYRCVYGEDVEAALRFLFNAMAPKQIDGFLFQGIPKMIYTDHGSVARSQVFQQVMRYLDIDVRAHLPQGKDGRRVTARSKGKVERPFRTVKEMHETLYHFHEPKDEEEANAWLINFLMRYNAMEHRSEPHSRMEDWLENLPASGVQAGCTLINVVSTFRGLLISCSVTVAPGARHDVRSRRSGVESRSGCGWSKNDGVRTPGHVRS